MSPVELTVLNMMPSSDFDESVRLHGEWGLRWMDLWGSVYGIASVDDLDEATAARAAETISGAGLRVYCQSTRVFNAHVEDGEEAFRRRHLGQLRRSLRIADLVRPHFVRLIAGRVEKTDPATNAVDVLKSDHPWVAGVYREAVAMIREAGYAATVENEARDCFLATADEFTDFFDWLALGDDVSLTWDVQNSWRMGVLPSRAQYDALRPLIGYLHLKGGRAAPGSSVLEWKSDLEDADWPVVEITQAAVDDAVSPVIALNPPHGTTPPGAEQPAEDPFRDATLRDLEFLRRSVRGLAP